MTITRATQAGQATAARLMLDACTIGHPDGDEVYDEGTDGYVTPLTTFYTGACKVKPRDNADRVVEAAGQTVSLWPYVVSVPMSVEDVVLDDVVTVTACDLDPSLVGVQLRVRQVTQGSFVTARRLGCEVAA